MINQEKKTVTQMKQLDLINQTKFQEHDKATFTSHQVMRCYSKEWIVKLPEQESYWESPSG